MLSTLCAVILGFNFGGSLAPYPHVLLRLYGCILLLVVGEPFEPKHHLPKIIDMCFAMNES